MDDLHVLMQFRSRKADGPQAIQEAVLLMIKVDAHVQRAQELKGNLLAHTHVRTTEISREPSAPCLAGPAFVWHDNQLADMHEVRLAIAFSLTGVVLLLIQVSCFRLAGERRHM